MPEDEARNVSMRLDAQARDQFSIYDTKASTDTAPTSRRTRDTSETASQGSSSGSESKPE